MTQRALVEFAGDAAADAEQDQPHRAADGRIGSVARAENVPAAIHSDLPCDGAVDDDQRSDHMRGGLNAVEIESRVGHGEHRRAHHWRVLGFAAGHHHVDGQQFIGQAAPSRRDPGDEVVGLSPQHVQHRGHPGRGGRDDGKSVTPRLVEVMLDKIAFRGDHCGHGVASLTLLGQP
ncbi:hypothetical protein MPRG_58460 [Mycobacterium paragordonae]|uniref:Uncharacterized protein n=1 Tax=Mycobacterium paragordonae TaxID=1389713 RepID=A0ABQ1CDM1_9MYCO|nr:hypothetical protein MPRG_58460 [Mycobacterium paragordonae]